MFHEYVLSGGCAALHTVNNDDVSTRFDCELHVIFGTSRTNLDVNGLFPIGNLADFIDLDFQIIRASQSG